MLELNEFFESKEQSKPFLIFGMPRSMTAWISCFLTCGKVFCQHELSGKLDSPQEIADSIRQQPFPFSGLADPGALMIWRELTELLPDANLIFIRRDPRESKASLAKVGGVQPFLLDGRYDALCQRASDFIHYAEPAILDFETLSTEQGLLALWQLCVDDHQLPQSHLTKMMTLCVTQKDEIIQAAANQPQSKGAFKW
jgi:hypothetical protein